MVSIYIDWTVLLVRKCKDWARHTIEKYFPPKIASFYKKAEEALWYIFFGVVTTLVNFAVYTLLTRLVLRNAFLENEAIVTMYANAIAWLLAVLAAFFLNRNFVFESKSHGKAFLFEFGSFFLMRALSGMLEILLPSLLIFYLSMHDLLAKALVSVIIIVSNYIFSKFVSFRKANRDMPI